MKATPPGHGYHDATANQGADVSVVSQVPLVSLPVKASAQVMGNQGGTFSANTECILNIRANSWERGVGKYLSNIMYRKKVPVMSSVECDGVPVTW